MRRKLDPPRLPDEHRSIDYDALYKLWVKTEMNPTDFLKLYGINATARKHLPMTKNWQKQRAKDSIHKQTLNIELNRTRTQKEIRDEFYEEQAKLDELRITRAKKIEETKIEQQSAILQMIEAWRLKQGEEDYTTANALRQHIKLKLRDSLTKTPAGKMHSMLSQKDIAAYAKSLVDIQKIQRLALGMSTDNIGVADQRETGTNTIPIDDDVPTFIVELNENGKFKRPRPRRVQNDRG